MGSCAPLADQMTKIEQIPIVGQATWRNNSLQHTGLLQRRHEICIRKLFIYPLLPIERDTRPKVEENGHGEQSSLAYINIGDRGSQRSSRHLCVTTANGEPHATCQRRQVIIGHHQEMHISVVPRIDEGSALIVWVVTPFLLLGVFRFREGSIFAYDFGGRIINGNLLPLTLGRTFAFHWCYDRIFDWHRLVRMFWGRRHSEGKGNEKKFWANNGKGTSLSINDNKDDVKGCNRLAVKRSIVLMKQKLCFSYNY